MSPPLTAKKKRTLLALLPEAFLENEESSHLAHDLRLIEEEIGEAPPNTWIYSLTAMMTILVIMFALLYTNTHQRALLENQILQNELASVKAQLERFEKLEVETRDFKNFKDGK